MASEKNEKAPSGPSPGRLALVLDWVERVGNKLPDPAVLFVILMFATWAASALLAPVQFTEVHPASGEPIRVINQLSGKELTRFMTAMVTTFTGFHPLGVVLVALLGVGVAEATGFVGVALKWLLSFTPGRLLTPMVILVGILSHTAADAGYVLVIPLGGVIFYAAGRHPLAGIAAAFAGVSGGFSANIIPAPIDPLLQGLTQAAAQIIDPQRQVGPLCNWLFTAGSALVIMIVGWLLTDRFVEPRLRATPVDAEEGDLPVMEEIGAAERRGFYAGVAAMGVGLIALVLISLPASSPLRSPADGQLNTNTAPLMQSIVPLIFLFFLVPGIVYGYVAGTVKSHRDVISGMSKTMSTMGYYLVMAFFAAQFIAAFGSSNVGVLLAVKGANFLRALGLPAQVTIVGIILLTATVNLLVGSASAKWALLSPIFVPMLMQLHLSPELTQAAYRIGDSCTNIITPLMPYFPLVVVFCQRYVKNTGIGTLTALMLPFSVTFLVTWILFLMVYWGLGIPLGFPASYSYP
jgi:aminobenzoyl-glutamate transport protein